MKAHYQKARATYIYNKFEDERHEWIFELSKSKKPADVKLLHLMVVD